MASDRNWSRLAARVKTRRKEIGYGSIGEFADALNISRKTIGKLERGKPVGGPTLDAVEDLLRWAPGSIRRILDMDGEPEVLPDVEDDDDAGAVTDDGDDDDEPVNVLATHTGAIHSHNATEPRSETEPTLAAQLRSLYQILGEEEYIRTCLHIGRGDQSAGSPPRAAEVG